MTTLTVSSAAELRAAYETLANTPGGGTIEVIKTDIPYSLTMIKPGGDMNPVTITSADPDDPAVFSLIRLEQVDNITFDSIEVDSSTHDRPDWLTDLHISWSDNVTIQNSYLHSTADGFLENWSDQAEIMSVIKGGRGFEFVNNTVEGYHHGLQLFDVFDTRIEGNDISKMEGDGMRMGGVQNMTIKDNYIHDFYGADQKITHSDMIQIWGTNAKVLTKDVVITGNILDTGDGAATQGIFIRNEQAQLKSFLGDHYERITITDNIVYNGHLHGIKVADATDIVIEDNTVLWDRDAQMVFGDDKPINDPPQIAVYYSGSATISNNITSGVLTRWVEDLNEDGNQKLNYWNSLNENYVGYHFVNGLTPGENDLRDLQLRPDSPWNGTVGSQMSWADDTTEAEFEAVMQVTENPTDRFNYHFDAGLSVDQSGYADDAEYTYKWTFSDGTQMEGREVWYDFEDSGRDQVILSVYKDGALVDEIERTVGVRMKDILEINFEDGLKDLSDNKAVLSMVGEKIMVPGKDGGEALVIGGGSKLVIDDSSGHLDGFEQFGLALDVRALGNNDTLLRKENAYGIYVQDDGSVHFWIETDKGKFWAHSEEEVFDDNDWHRVGIAYDAYEGRMAVFADGEEIASAEAEGIIKNTSDDLYLTHRKYTGMEAEIDNLVMSRDPGIAGMESTAVFEDWECVGKEPPVVEPPAEEPVAEEPPVDVPPVEEPVAEEPPVEEPVAEEPAPEEPIDEAPPVDVPPVEEPRAEDPSAPEDPAVDAEDPVNDDLPEPGAVPPSTDDEEDSGGFFSFIMDLIMALFGGGRSSDKSKDVIKIAEANQEGEVFELGDIIPLTGVLDETLPGSQDQDDQDNEVDFAA